MDMQMRHGYSALGFGCMRFPRTMGRIDQKEAAAEILRACELGVNYFDTAYIYPGSEAALGTILERAGIRDRVRIATKLPQYLIRDRAAIDRYFDEQRSRLKTGRVDNYLMHMLTDIDAWRKLQSLGIEEWIAAKKRAGQIDRIGFSYHGNTAMFLQILEAYPWDFCQIQYNYVDEVSQAGRIGLQAAAEKNIPVIIMEPLRGGRLVDRLPRAARERIAREGGGRTAAELALRWLWDQPEVTCVLSGMNSMAMVEENCRIAAEALPVCMDDAERSLIASVKKDIGERTRIGCTGCGYCMPCPKGVDIPGTFSCYNLMSEENRFAGWKAYFQTVAMRRDPPFAGQCVGCGRCESHCPQHLPIISTLKDADKALRPFFCRIGIAAGRRLLFRRKREEANKDENADRAL